MQARPAPEQEVPTADLTEAQVHFFQENGFLQLERITTNAEVEWLRGVYDRLFAARTGEAEGRYFDLGGPRGHTGKEVLPQILAPERTAPELCDTLVYRNARRLAARLLQCPEATVMGGGHMILKPAQYGHETPWHQDEAYWSPDVVLERVSIWVPLDPATVESGCMQFIPGSHHTEIRTHRHIGNNPLIHGLVTDEVDPAQAVACPIPAGGATCHHPRTLHYSGPNVTLHSRRAYVLVLGAPPKVRDVPARRPWLDEEQRALQARSGQDGAA